MKLYNPTIFLRFIFLSIPLLLLTACNQSSPTIKATHTAGISSAQEYGGLPASSIATLRSLEKVDVYPLYVMHYYGEYEYPQTSSTLPGGSFFSCSLFATLGETEDMLYGRNFDWEYSPALLLFTDPPDGYASASMIDLTFLGINPADSMTLTDIPLVKRASLLSAPSMPFDGINEYGLAIAMAAVPEQYADDASFSPSKPTIGSIGIIRQILDHARNVDEAVAIFDQYNINFGGGPPIHYLLADSSGKAVLIEFYQEEILLLPNDTPWHLATNHLRCIAKGNGGCERYQTLSERLAKLDGEVDSQDAMRLLSEVRQDSTQWSAIYNMTNGAINLVIGGSYDHVYTFQIDLVDL